MPPICRFPSTRRCSERGYVTDSKPLSVRPGVDCPRCEASHDRDINAAENIRTAGLAGASRKANGSGGHSKMRDAFRIERSRTGAHGPVNEQFRVRARSNSFYARRVSKNPLPSDSWSSRGRSQARPQ
ncbi:zinc ribbon domain-containing protein [Salinibacter ruber]|uniref:zinc ribbon domain-containing protein n=1 Tax=Salinibacter ruber TaxID=146919 RepID=UPI00311AB455